MRYSHFWNDAIRIPLFPAVDVEYGYYPDDAKLVVSSYRLMHSAVTGA